MQDVDKFRDPVKVEDFPCEIEELIGESRFVASRPFSRQEGLWVRVYLQTAGAVERRVDGNAWPG